MTQPTVAAEEIIISYGILERTISVQELVAFANGEGLSRQLSQYAKLLDLSETDLEGIRQALNQPAALNQVELSQFLYTTQGETLLDILGEVIQTPTRQSGSLAIRAAFILAAADPDQGLTLLNFLMKYPTPGLRIDVGRGLAIAGTVTETLEQSQQAIALVNARANVEAQTVEGDLFATWILLGNRAPYQVERRFLPVNSGDTRPLDATLFLPQPFPQGQALPESIPVIIISHGLGDEGASYAYLANYLASQGFAVATLDHPGSNSAQIGDLLSGLSPNLIDAQEFLQRPQDISSLLDTIDQLALQDPTFRNRLDIQTVGVVGQSFGGYTALALAGATLTGESLTTSCGPQLIYLNPSLLLQCQAADVVAEELSLRDERVKAIAVVNPVGSSLFGPAGYGAIDIPVMMMAATADTVAPALVEQIEPFTWLQTRDRYLAMVGNTTHFSVIATNPNVDPSIPVPPILLGESPELAQQYLQTLSLAFFQSHLRQDQRFDAA
ncbi:MAG: alpha/beta fold hydrolase, partial [Cyanobacteria bacterium P01_H01_bin.58]